MESLFIKMETPSLAIYETRKYSSLTQEQELELSKRYLEFGDIDAGHMLVVSNIKNVVAIARNYLGFGVPLDDLVQEGIIGLLIAIRKFNPEKGLRFMTYASWWVRAKIVDMICRNQSLVKVARNQTNKRVFSGYKKLLSEEHSQEKTLSEQSFELSQRFDVDPLRIEEIIIRFSSRDYSLDSPISDEFEASYLDRIQDDETDLEKAAIWEQGRANVRRKIVDIMPRLSERERDILIHRFMADTPMTLQELGDKYSLSKERIRQIEERLIERLKVALASENRMLAIN